MVKKNMIQNGPITDSDVTNNNPIFGPNISGNKGKKVQHNLDRVVMDYIAVHREFLKWHKFLTLVADVMFVNNITILINVSRSINFVAIEHMPTCMSNQLSKYFIYLWKYTPMLAC